MALRKRGYPERGREFPQKKGGSDLGETMALYQNSLPLPPWATILFYIE